jgi:flagellar hook-associated protein 3 FlgL
MRISTANGYDTSIDNIVRRQVEMARAQDQLTSGKRVARASDDPAAAARAERALASESRAVSSQRAVDASRAAMQQSESALGEAVDLLHAAREAVVASGNGTYSDAERKVLAEKLRGIRDQLFQVANRPGSDGGYLFSSQGSSFPPFIDQPPDPTKPLERTGVVFRGVPGLTRGEQGTSLPLSADGAAAWTTARTGNGVFETRPGAGVTNAWIDSGSVINPSALQDANYDITFTVSGGVTTYSINRTLIATGVTSNVVPPTNYTPAQAITLDGMAFSINGSPANGDQFKIQPSVSELSVFGVLDKAVADLSISGTTSAQRAQATGDALRNLDSVMSKIQAVRSAAGEVLNRVETETSRLTDQKLAARTERSLAEDLDIAKAISEFQLKQSGYDAALKSYSMVQRLSLFQYINS